MNILRIVYDWPDENVITGGLAPAPFELSKAQTKLGHFVFVLCGNLNGKNLLAKRFRIFIPEFFIEIFNLPRAISGIGPFFTTSILVVPYYFYLRIKNKIDIVHNHGHLGVWFLLYKYLFGWLDKTPVVGHFHNTAKGREQAIEKQGGRIPFPAKYIEYPIHKFSDWLMLKVCDEVIVVGETLADELVEFYNIDKKHIHLVESGVDSDRFNKIGEKIDFGFGPDAIIILNIGRLSKRKNIDVLAEAMTKLPREYKLVLCGEWDPGFRKKVEEIITSQKLRDRVKYIGKVSYFNVDRYFRSAQIFVLPSSYEGLPKVVLEALSSGCRVIASGFKIDRQIPDLKFIHEITSDVIAEEIVESHESGSNYDKTKKIIDDFYSWDTKANQVEGIYKLLLKRKILHR